MDTITIKNLKLFAYHGVNPEEKENGQTFYLDVRYGMDLQNACESDDLADTVSYAAVIKTIRRVFTAQSFDLIEKAAQAVCDALFEAFPPVQTVEITLKKPEAPVKAEVEYVAVTLTRARGEQ